MMLLPPPRKTPDVEDRFAELALALASALALAAALAAAAAVYAARSVPGFDPYQSLPPSYYRGDP